ncbi:MAG: hypothetical protein IKV71_07055 [Psychrobacter sp.]|nr:hypothetical protein [Psychrobacter sp.]
MSSTELARRKGIIHCLDFAIDLIWVTKDSHLKFGNYVIIHCMNHNQLLGKDYFPCENITELNDIKSKLINSGFKLKWDAFNDAAGWLNDNT